MNREKLNKAAGEDWCNNVLERDLKPITKSAFKRGVNWLMQQPLSERLTDEEKEKIREIYWQAAKDWIGIGDARGHCRACIAIEKIFGADLFKEK